MRWGFLISLLISLPSAAEYRMFLLQVTSADGTPGAQIPSNLDPDQYRGYHPLKEGETLSYIDTWMCRGRTNEQPPCPSPRDPASLSPEPTASTPASVVETPAAPPAPAESPAVATPP